MKKFEYVHKNYIVNGVNGAVLEELARDGWRVVQANWMRVDTATFLYVLLEREVDP